MGEILNVMKLYGLIKAKRKGPEPHPTSITSMIKASEEPAANPEEALPIPEGKPDAETK
jgi:hypothetical protein